MSLLGIDVGTTGCKVAAFDASGRPLSAAYREYGANGSELDPEAVWLQIQECIREAVGGTGGDPVTALSVSSLGEAVVPVTRDRRILGPSILNFDPRGAEYVEGLRAAVPDAELYALNGNSHGNNYGLTKQMWIRDHAAALYERADCFLLWSGFVSYMLGAEACVDFSLANRTLCFDLERGDWSPRMLSVAGLDAEKLPRPVPTGTVIGQVPREAAAATGLPEGAAIVAGAHDQCANAVGCGVVGEGAAMYGMGTFTCIVPVFASRPDPSKMVPLGLNTEHHAVPDRFVSFIYNQGGSLLKWYRDTFAARDHLEAKAVGQDVYDALLAEMPAGPSGLVVLPHFTTTGPPEFIDDSCGMIAGLKLETTRGQIAKGILEGTTFYLRELTDALPEAGLRISEYTAVGGGAKSPAWVQLAADIMGVPFRVPEVTEAGTLGAALIAGVGTGVYGSHDEAVAAAVRVSRAFEPNMKAHEAYEPLYAQYRKTAALMRDYLRELASLSPQPAMPQRHEGDAQPPPSGKLHATMCDGRLPERWIHGFRRTGRRDLSEDERARARRLAVKHRLRSFEWGCLAVICGLSIFVGIAIAAGGPSYGWMLMLLGTAAMCWVICIANAAEERSLLFRRAFRKGQVDVYARTNRQPEPNGADYPHRGDWVTEEKFEERIAKQAGRTPATFETPVNDVVLFAVEGIPVTRVIDSGKPEPLCDEED